MDQHVQVPIAILGMACRLPGHCNTPEALWDLMLRGEIASNVPPPNRFNLFGHHDASQKPYTMKTPGAMFMEDVDPADFDAHFFNINYADACSMDPQQRGLMEVAYECLENSGVPMESLRGRRVGCVVGASSVDYHDMDCRDPEDRTDSPTLGTNRSLLGNRISHFLNVHGPSLSIDTACSSALTALDMACLYLGSNQVDAMLVGGANIYLSPECNQDMGTMRATASPSGRCHAFDAKADGYVAAEAINVVFLKRLDDAIRDKDPIRAVIRGTAVNSAGKTPGIAMPDPSAQAMATLAAYANAGIPAAQLAETGYVECHGTGTPVGDPIEVQGVSTAFSPSRTIENPLAIGSVKGNIGHSEAASGVSSLIKVVLAIEKGIIPGTATFQTPNPQIDFKALRVRAFRNSQEWPSHAKRRASINSFGFGGANGHAVIESSEYIIGEFTARHKSSYLGTKDVGEECFDNLQDTKESTTSLSRPKIVILSANDEEALHASIKALSTHLLNPGVRVSLDDLAYTLSERRSRLYHRAYCVQRDAHITESSFVMAKVPPQPTRVAFVFTGQGAQWPLMGKDLLRHFPQARSIIERLDTVLGSLPDPPKWSMADVLTKERDPEVLRSPELSQPLATALQLAYLAVLSDWGVKPVAVIGHSSGEVVAAVAARRLTAEDAIKVAFYRGQAAKERPPDQKLGMLAVGLSAEAIQGYLDQDDGSVKVACFNSPRSLTLSGTVQALERLRDALVADKHFARMLQVDFAYHSNYMEEAGKRYSELIQGRLGHSSTGCHGVTWFSTVTGKVWDKPVDSAYWVQNMLSQVRFHQSMEEMLGEQDGPNFLVEVGPSSTLASPISQICTEASHLGVRPTYTSIAKRGPQTLEALYGVVGKLFLNDGPIDLDRVNDYTDSASIIIDLPNYKWNRSMKYWHESLASKDWRFRPFVKHDLLGTKVLGTPWFAPVWRNRLRLKNLPWLGDHRLGKDIIFPAAGYICMAMEAVYQTTYMTTWMGSPVESYNYRMRDVKFLKALVLNSSDEASEVMLSLSAITGSSTGYKFTVFEMREGTRVDHATGLISIETGTITEKASESDLSPFRYPKTPQPWYQRMREGGFDFGPAFQTITAMEYAVGQRTGRAKVSTQSPSSPWKHSTHLLHPVAMDGCFQSVVPSVWEGDSTNIGAALVPSRIDSLVVPFRSTQPEEVISLARSDYMGIGRRDVVKNYSSSCKAYRPDDGSLCLDLRGLQYAKIDALAQDEALAHTYCQLVWDADITALSDEALTHVAEQAASARKSDGTDAEKKALSVVQRLIDLASHKKPQLSVLEVNLDPMDSFSIYLDMYSADSPLRMAYSRYTLTSSSASTLVDTKRRYAEAQTTDFIMADFLQDQNSVNGQFDLAIVKIPDAPGDVLGKALERVQERLFETGIGLVFHPKFPLGPKIYDSFLGACGSWRFKSNSVSVFEKLPEQYSTPRTVRILQFTDGEAQNICKGLAELYWDTYVSRDPLEVEPGSNVLFVDELQAPVLSSISEHQWNMLKVLVEKNCNILWVTSGSQMSVVDPKNALVSGLFRSIRNEMPFLKLINLDAEYFSSTTTIRAISYCLELLTNEARTNGDFEFVERGGIINISRVLPSVPLNKVKTEEVSGREVETMDLHSSKSLIRLQAERVGSLDSLQYTEVISEPPELQKGHVEIEVLASGVNFKDVATTVGIVPGNEHLLGGEGSGIIKRVASDVTSLSEGQRVVFFKPGSFGNRVQASTRVVHAIPDSMSFEDAATVPCVFMTALYALFHLASVKSGDRVLIHSAAGGVGLAALQLCQYIGAEIYATVGTQEKRDFLKSNYNIPYQRIYSSRTTEFAGKIMEQTMGRGVNFILNSLAGALLDESWRIISSHGTMVEIGKKDILNHNMLAMEPFNRNASFRALDISHGQMDDDVVHSLLSQIFGLLNKGHIKPISPVQVFPFSEVPAALRLMRSGKHIGKLVISDAGLPESKLPVRPASRSTKVRPDVSYLVVGGLRGLCKSLAILLAKLGARHLILMSRRGVEDDEASASISHDLGALGCHVEMAQGDVASMSDVRRVFARATKPIGGIIQGAMVLNDHMFSSMSATEFHAAITCKVRGTWNLHNVAIENGLDLDYFTMLSSVSGIYGTKGQANYAAANAFLDAFALYRQSLGLPACSLVLGIIEDVGYMARHEELKSRFDDSVWQPINERHLRRVFQLSLQQQRPTTATNQEGARQIITGFRVPQAQGSPLLHDARFRGLCSQTRTSVQDGSRDGPSTLETLRVMGKSQTEIKARLEVVSRLLNGYLMKSLQLSEPLDFARPLAVYGVDSLAAVEFRNFLKVELGVELTILEVVNASSVTSICESIVKQVDNGF